MLTAVLVRLPSSWFSSIPSMSAFQIWLFLTYSWSFFSHIAVSSVQIITFDINNNIHCLQFVIVIQNMCTNGVAAPVCVYKDTLIMYIYCLYDISAHGHSVFVQQRIMSKLCTRLPTFAYARIVYHLKYADKYSQTYLISYLYLLYICFIQRYSPRLESSLIIPRCQWSAVHLACFPLCNHIIQVNTSIY